MEYNRLQLQNLIQQASNLGFYDDVRHWKKELEKLDNLENGKKK